MSDATQTAIRKVCNDLANFLCEKNEAYGDSAVNPIRIRSKASSLEQILVRQDDKLNRLYNGREFAGDDDLKDLVGYWVLEQVVRERNEAKGDDSEPERKQAQVVVRQPFRDLLQEESRKNKGVGIDPKECCSNLCGGGR